MSLVRAKDTAPEIYVRKIVHSLGYRYRLHESTLPGKPDLTFRRLRKAIFVHGCFWHQHGCNQYRMPLTRRSFWDPKLRNNVSRDAENYRKLNNLGWAKLVLWECQLTTKNRQNVTTKIQQFMAR